MMDQDSVLLRTSVLAELPRPSLSLLQRLETHARRRIEFSLHPAPLFSGDPSFDVPACEITAEGATIRLPHGAPISSQGVTHELLHLERWWLDGVPQIYPAVRRAKRMCELLENALEHPVIVPREALYGFDPYPHWNEIYRQIWQTPLPVEMLPDARRGTCLLAWLATSHMTDARVIGRIEACLRAEGYFDDADVFKREILATLPDKARTAVCVSRHLEIPQGAMVLRFYDAPSGTVRHEPVPYA